MINHQALPKNRECTCGRDAHEVAKRFSRLLRESRLPFIRTSLTYCMKHDRTLRDDMFLTYEIPCFESLQS